MHQIGGKTKSRIAWKEGGDAGFRGRGAGGGGRDAGI